MYFLIDYENTGSRGFQGVEYLLPEDRLTIFYSEECLGIERGILNRLFETHCQADICKLADKGKNGLDFYIASKIGEVFGNGYEGSIAIVSKDQGFRSVQSYWKKKAEKKQRIILNTSVEQCIRSAAENHTRTALVQRQLKKISLETEFAKHEERIRLRNKLEELFKETKYWDEIDKIQKILGEENSRKIIYLEALKTFGKKDGLEIYRRTREMLAA